MKHRSDIPHGRRPGLTTTGIVGILALLALLQACDHDSVPAGTSEAGNAGATPGGRSNAAEGGAGSNTQDGGAPTQSDAGTPNPTSGAGATPGRFSLGEDSTCAISDGRVRCLGMLSLLAGGTPAEPFTIPGVEGATQVALGGDRWACALLRTGGVTCWGASSVLDPVGLYVDPAPVEGLEDAVSLSVGGAHVCAVIDDGSVRCAGNDYRGGLGRGHDRMAPIDLQGFAVVDLAGVVSLDLGSSMSCAIDADSTLWCWGAIAMPNRGSSPVPIEQLPDVVDAAAGRHHMCALRDDGRVACRGSNNHGELGNGTTEVSDDWVDVVDLEDVVDIDASADQHSCAVTAAGAVYCWGDNAAGQLGVDGEDSSVPVQVPGVDDAISVELAGMSTCVVRARTGVTCWGNNRDGQLGPSAPEQGSAPTLLPL